MSPKVSVTVWLVQISWCLKVPWPQVQQVALCLLSCLAMTTTPEQKGRGHRELGLMHPTVLFLTSPLPAVLPAGSPGGVWGCLNSVYPSLGWPWICSDLPRHYESEPGTLIEKQVLVRAWPNTRPGWEKSQTITSVQTGTKYSFWFAMFATCQTAQRLVKNRQNTANHSGQNAQFH